MNDEEKRKVYCMACHYLVNHHKTLREVERELGVSRSTLDGWIHKHLPSIDPELYSDVCEQFKKNLKNIGEKRRTNKNGRKE